MDFTNITLFRSIVVFCGTDSNMQSIPHIQPECKECSVGYCQSNITLLWVGVMFCKYQNIIFVFMVLSPCLAQPNRKMEIKSYMRTVI